MHCSNWCSLNKIKASSLFFLKDKFASSLMHGERWHGGCCAALAMRATDRRNRKVVRVPAPHRDMLTLKKKNGEATHSQDRCACSYCISRGGERRYEVVCAAQMRCVRKPPKPRTRRRSPRELCSVSVSCIVPSWYQTHDGSPA